ncbi:MAG: hypothetical protein ACR2JR_03375 [Rubrobacteraceae bacterium]
MDPRTGRARLVANGPDSQSAAVSGRRVTAAWLVWSSWTLTALAVAFTLFFVSLNEMSAFGNTIPTSVLILAFSTVGALVASRRPGNRIGWLFCSGSLLWALGELALEYAVYALITVPGSLPAASWAAWFGGWARGMGWFLIVVFLLLLFPTGRLPSASWRPVLWGGVGFIFLFTLASWLSPVSNDMRMTSVSNPLGLEGGIGLYLIEAVFLVLPPLILVSGAAGISRFRRARGEERQQLKWFAYAVGVMAAVFVVWFSLALAGFAPASVAMWTVPPAGLPVAVGIAILRHRLYDIDIIINRTLVYGALTVMLVLVYFGGVVGLQYVFRVLAGGNS